MITRLGVAVSGGGDSTALLCLLAEWAADGGPIVEAVTVDHGLRAQAASEAREVGRLSGTLGINHTVLRWEDRDGPGNLSDRARRARYALIAEWAKERAINTVALGHTLDDQAETVLIRLQRGSGVDGLSGMRKRRIADGIEFVRPLLGVRRERLRVYLRSRGIGWAEDPTNDDDAYRRVQARRVLSALAPMGIGPETLAATAVRMSMASEALWHMAREVATTAGSVEDGDLRFRASILDAAPEDTRFRIFAAALQFVGQSEYRPRLDALKRLLDGLSDEPRTLAGCVTWKVDDTYRVSREAAAARSVVEVGRPWDGRWRIEGPAEPGMEVRALGAVGLAQCPGAARETGLSRPTLLASPAVWSGDDLVSAPIARPDGNWRAVPLTDMTQFVARLNVS